MQTITTIGLDIAKSVFQVHGVDAGVEAAEQDHPGPHYLVADLAELDLPARGITDPFDVILSAGNVMTFLAPSTRVQVLRRWCPPDERRSSGDRFRCGSRLRIRRLLR